MKIAIKNFKKKENKDIVRNTQDLPDASLESSDVITYDIQIDDYHDEFINFSKRILSTIEDVFHHYISNSRKLSLWGKINLLKQLLAILYNIGDYIKILCDIDDSTDLYTNKDLEYLLKLLYDDKDGNNYDKIITVSLIVISSAIAIAKNYSLYEEITKKD